MQAAEGRDPPREARNQAGLGRSLLAPYGATKRQPSFTPRWVPSFTREPRAPHEQASDDTPGTRTPGTPLALPRQHETRPPHDRPRRNARPCLREQHDRDRNSGLQHVPPRTAQCVMRSLRPGELRLSDGGGPRRRLGERAVRRHLRCDDGVHLRVHRQRLRYVVLRKRIPRLPASQARGRPVHDAGVPGQLRPLLKRSKGRRATGRGTPSPVQRGPRTLRERRRYSSLTAAIDGLSRGT